MAKPQGVIPSPEAWAEIVDTVRHTRVHRPVRKARRMPRRRNVGGGTTRTGDPSFGAPWTIAEYEPATGGILGTFYRGRNRGATTGSLFDTGMLWSSDDFLYASGSGDINADTGCIVKWNPSSREKEWESSDNGGNATVFPTTNAAVTEAILTLVEASDGFIWSCSGPGGTSYITRTNPETGVQSHSYGTAAAMQLFRADNSGGIVIHNQAASPYLRVLDNTATSTATHTTTTFNVNENNGVLCCTSTSAALRLLNADDLTTIDSLAAPSGVWLGAVSDGTHVYAAYSANYTKLDATNLAAAALWTNTKDTDLSLNLFLHDGRLYDCHYQNANNNIGGVVKIDTSTGAELWDYTNHGRVLHEPSGIAFGSDFVVFVTIGTNTYTVVCVNDSDGSLRWRDTWSGVRKVLVAPDDRVFVCGQKLLP